MTQTFPASYFSFLKFSKVYFAVSLLFLIPGALSLIFHGLRPSIDFTGGTLLEIKTAQPVSPAEIAASVAKFGFQPALIQSSGDRSYFLRFSEINSEQGQQLASRLDSDLGGVALSKYESIGPSVGSDLTRKAFVSVFLASLCIVVYLAYSFRNIPRPYSSWKFGLTAVAALVHDVLIVAGLFSILGWLAQVQVDALFVTALLTIIGFSVHDTIVVFDRIRENLIKYPRAQFTQVVDFSLTETIGRSLNTSATILLVLLALLLFSLPSIRFFILALLVGVASGTYSSFFTAAPLLSLWSDRRTKN